MMGFLNNKFSQIFTLENTTEVLQKHILKKTQDFKNFRRICHIWSQVTTT